MPLFTFSSEEPPENVENNPVPVANCVPVNGESKKPFLRSRSSGLFTSKYGSNERRVLVIYTGGTIGMVHNKDGVLAPQKNVFEKLIREFPQLHDEKHWLSRRRNSDFDASFLVLPKGCDMNLRILYKIHEYENLLDSSNMTEVEWIRIAEDIKRFYEEYDGFVVLHGTDTLSYTASALSFMFENIGKGVVLTGSQIPIFEPRSDGVDNFVSSLIIAGGLNIPEVTIFFGSKLLRGNRTRKISVKNLFAFDSPNCVPIVEVGLCMEVNKAAIFKPNVIEKFTVHAKMSKNVGLLRIFPSISSAVIKAFCQPPIEGVVLESYGAGNIPSNRQDILDVIEAAVKRGVIVVVITQCNNGAVAALYETGQLLSNVGVVSGYDMTPEAALTKLSYVLSKTELSYKQKTDMMANNIRGELTNISSLSIQDQTLKEALATSLNIQSPKKLTEVTEKVITSLLLYGIEHNDEAVVKKLLEMGADVNEPDAEGRTPLHEAIIVGHVPLVEYLLKNGANVHYKTRTGESPLMTAVNHHDKTIIDLLMKCGAHFAIADTKAVSEMLTQAAKKGKIKRLESLKLAGADLNTPDELLQTPLHKAVLFNSIEAVQYLVGTGATVNERDILGHTPLDYAVRLNRRALETILAQYMNAV
ncbi:hypothetical protein K1T71_010665 [Dendrolimus kikuchii]|uniref:Uncharacterized protein n=1 Tax=Dendrolimus kikuchii TaxID=765133 RepID=A0ACC1CPQ8_9NEOP|nr:hypothetical protein K1T71_010665 [Dendrolimus kikuchii]